MKYKLLLWGVGAKYNALLNRIDELVNDNQIEIVGITGNSGIPQSSYLDGYRVVDICDISYLKFDYIVILNDTHFTEILCQICQMLGDTSKVLSYRVFELPGLIFEEYVELKESNLTIISNNCWAGTAYNCLGLECLSPIKNLFITDVDYLKLLHDLKGYFSKELRYKSNAIDPHSGKQYPVMTLGDIEVNCNHALNYEEAIKQWNRRCKKVNYNNLFIEMYTEDKAIEIEFSELEYEKKICFVPYDSDLNSSLKVELYKGQKMFWQAVNSNASRAGLKYDLISLLLKNEIKMRY